MEKKKSFKALVLQIQTLQKEETGKLKGGFFLPITDNSVCNNPEDCSDTKNGDCCNDKICLY